MGNAAFGKYRLIAELGHGGMADVFLAVQAGPAGSGFRKLSVIKRLRQNLADEPEFIAMLVDEARIAARLNHPNVVQTNEVGNVGNQYFLAMEYLDGQPLHRIQHRSTQKVKAGEPAPLTSALQYLILMDALAGLHHAHELLDYDGTPLDIVHRDMTPQNIFLTYEGQVKVVDFGIAKAAGRSSETRQGVVKGKVRYMAPEQALGLRVSRRTDVFALGIMLWEAAVGKRMWRDYEELQVVRALVSGELPPMPRDLEPSVPEEMDAIIRKALSPRAEDRHATADELRTDIEQYLANSGQLVALRRQLAPMLTTLFKDKRAEIRQIIEQQLATIDDSQGADLAIVPQDSASTSLKLSLPPRSMPTDAPPASTTVSAAGVTSSLPQPLAPSRSRGLVIAAACAGLVAGGIGIWKVASSPMTPSHAFATTDSATVSLELSASPSNARLSVDGRPFEPSPLTLHVKRDESEHRVRVEAEGYEPKTETVTFAQDLHATFSLSRAVAAGSAHSPEPTGAPRPASTPARAGAAPILRMPTGTKTPEPRAEAPSVTPPAPPAPQPPSRPTAAPARSLDKADPWGTAPK